MPPRGRGRGHLQRAEQRRSDIRSSTAEYLIEQWAFGLLTAVVVQVIALKTVRDHQDEDGESQSPPLLQKLARLGTFGAHPQNVHTEFQNALKKAVGEPDVFRFECPMLSLKRREGRRLLAEANHAMISPFAFFSWLYETHPVDFARRFLG